MGTPVHWIVLAFFTGIFRSGYRVFNVRVLVKIRLDGGWVLNG